MRELVTSIAPAGEERGEGLTAKNRRKNRKIPLFIRYKSFEILYPVEND